MIGRSAETSTPTIMFCGKDKKTCNRFRDIIKKSGILDGYPGFQTGTLTEEFRRCAGGGRKRNKASRRACSTTQVEVLTTRQRVASNARIEIPILHHEPPVTTLHHNLEFGDIAEGVKDGEQMHIGSPILQRQAILYSPSDIGPGMRIVMEGFPYASSPWRLATGGGFVRHRGSIYLATVAHAFFADVVDEFLTPPEDCDIEFELDENIGEEDIDHMRSYSVSLPPSVLDDETISRKTFSETSSEYDFDQRSTMMAWIMDGTAISTAASTLSEEPRPVVKPDGFCLPVGEHIILSKAGDQPGSLDYCLIEIESDALLNHHRLL